MSGVSAPSWWNELARRVSRHTGFAVRDRELHKLVPFIDEEVRKSGAADWPAYYALLDGEPLSAPVWQALLGYILIGETSLFRHAQQFDFVRDAIFRDRNRTFRCWSAGCSTGEEAFTIAMTALEAGARSVEIRATDLSMSALRAAMQGRVTLRRAEPEPRARRWLQRRSDGWYVRDAVRSLISWEWANLVQAEEYLARRGPFDLIICRNVLLYFRPEASDAVLAAFERGLTPNGWLLLGHAESLLFRQTEFRIVAGGLAYARGSVPPLVAVTAEPDASPRSDPADLVREAVELEAKRKTAEAALLLRRALRNDDSDMLIHLCLSGIYRRCGQVDAAERELRHLARHLDGRPDGGLVPGGDGLTIGAIRQAVTPYVAGGVA